MVTILSLRLFIVFILSRGKDKNGITLKALEKVIDGHNGILHTQLAH